MFVLIRDFEEFVNSAARLPLTSKVILDEDDVYAFLDHLRQLLPEELDRARRLLAERDRLLQQARSEVESMVRQTESYLERLTREAEVTRKAEEQARRILAQAEARAREIRASANAYAEDVLERVGGILRKAMAAVDEGRQELRATLEAAGAGGGERAAQGEAAAGRDRDDAGEDAAAT
ncbi:MAG TPA: hypothetical protein VIK92_08780 [Thermaerobacter sp.]